MRKICCSDCDRVWDDTDYFFTETNESCECGSRNLFKIDESQVDFFILIKKQMKLYFENKIKLIERANKNLINEKITESMIDEKISFKILPKMEKAKQIRIQKRLNSTIDDRLKRILEKIEIEELKEHPVIETQFEKKRRSR